VAKILRLYPFRRAARDPNPPFARGGETDSHGRALVVISIGASFPVGGQGASLWRACGGSTAALSSCEWVFDLAGFGGEAIGLRRFFCCTSGRRYAEADVRS